MKGYLLPGERAPGVVKTYPLTHPQMGIWYMEKLFPNISMGNVCGTLRFQADVDYELLERALNLFIEKNDAVRLRITESEGQPRQYVSEYSYRKLEFFDFSRDINELYKWDEKQSRIPFDIIDSDLFYIALIKTGEIGGFYIKMHHLAADAWSMSSCGNQVIEYYSMLKNGLEIPPGNRASFFESIESEALYRKSARFEKDRRFWSEKFADWRELTMLKSRKTGATSTKARRKTMLLPQKLSDKIREYCRENGVSEYSLFIAAVSMYINRVTGREDVTIGTTLLNRSGAREKEAVGMFASIAVPLRLAVRDDMNFEGFIRDISKEIISVLRHQRYPYDLLLSDVRERLLTADSLFDIVVNYQNARFDKSDELGECISRWHFNGHQIESLIMNLSDRDGVGRLVVDYDFLTDMFYVTEIEFIHQHIISLLWHALDNPVRPIARLELISEAEKHKILRKFNNTDAEFPRGYTAHRVFEEQADKTPDAPALYCGDGTLTYRQLNERANRVAHTLRQKGVGPDSVVGLMVYRSAEMVIGVLGILKAGGAYLPVDPDYPAERIAFMLQNCGATELLTHAKTKGFFQTGINLLDLDDMDGFSADISNPAPVSGPENLAYVIYTSGSTGNPKGVMLEHRGLVNRINWMQKKYPLDENSVILQKTPYTFDVSVWELTWWFFVGAKVCMLRPGGEKDPSAIVDAVRRYRVTTMHFVPSMLGIFLEFLDSRGDTGGLSSLTQVFASGEALSMVQVSKFNRLLYETNGTKLSNLYGPTEASIDVSYFDCSPWGGLKSVPIGRPIDNTRLYILDHNLTMVPIGIPGELCIGGVGLARGYMNNPSLTDEKFVPDPFVPGERIYKTGDLARWYAQGDIEYLGRLDHQIKIRGFRIELGEIEARLQEHPGIREAVAAGIELDGKKSLCAYYTGEAEIGLRELRRFITASLPDYMVPSYFVRLEAFPLSSNGKIDRKKLPLPSESGSGASPYVPPRNETDEALAAVYARILGRSRVGIDDVLFDIGGDSLSVIQIYTEIFDKDWGITAADFYDYPTIRELSDRIARGPGGVSAGEIENPDWNGDYVPSGRTRSVSGVLLTGATGFLGAHILAGLMESTNAAVYCLVRGADGADSVKRLLGQLRFYFGSKYDAMVGTRIFAVNGDVGEERMGISPGEYAYIGAKADTVIHAAALTRFLGSYEQISRVNVGGTREAVAFASKYNCTLHHISTVTVTGDYLVHNKVGGEYTERDFYVGQSYMENPYVRSKFEAEQLVYRAAGNGLKATVCRMGNLTGRLSDGVFQPNIADNGFYSAMRSIIAGGTLSGAIVDEEVEFSPVDEAARALILIALQEGCEDHIFHVFNPHSVRLSEIAGMLDEIGISLRAGAQAQAGARRADIKENAGIEMYLNESGELAFPPSFKVTARLTESYLKSLGFEWTRTDSKYLSNVVGYLEKVNFLIK